MAISHYPFPHNKRADMTSHFEQMAKVLEEVQEAIVAIHDYLETPTDENELAAAVETIDVWIASTEAVNKIDRETYFEAYEFVMSKGRSRGDWE